MEEKDMEEKEINEIKEIEKDWKDLYIRLYAEFDNYRKRVSKEKEEIKRHVKAESIDIILELDSDISIATSQIKDKNSLNSIKIFSDKIKSFLKGQGIEEIQTETYDPDTHEVISIMETGESKITVVSKGYKMNGVVIKYPKIILNR